MYKTVYGPWRGLAGAFSDSYCPLNYTRYNYGINYH